MGTSLEEEVDRMNIGGSQINSNNNNRGMQ
jgi:hypothetical protein